MTSKHFGKVWFINCFFQMKTLIFTYVLLRETHIITEVQEAFEVVGGQTISRRKIKKHSDYCGMGISSGLQPRVPGCFGYIPEPCERSNMLTKCCYKSP